MRTLTRLLGLLVLIMMLGACQSAKATETAVPAGSANTSAQQVILIDGSSTVGPVTTRVAEEFQSENQAVAIQVEISGTGGGFKKFCDGKIDIADASRPIKEAEIAQCRQNGIEYIELPVAFDGVAVLTNPQNDFVSCLTTEELRQIWSPEAGQKITTWRQVRADFPDLPLVLYGPGMASGTYDYFTEAIVGVQGESRPDYWASEDDDLLVSGISNDVNALGFFGLSYYDRNREKLNLVGVDNNRKGCVQPNTETVSSGLYQPLSRPLFIYVNRKYITEKEFTGRFVDFYLTHAATLVDDVGYIPLTDTLYELSQKRFNARLTGSVFEGSGATVGVSLADLLARENNPQ